MARNVFLLQVEPGDASAAAILGAEDVGVLALDIAGGGHRDDDVGVGDEILDRELAFGFDDLRAALVAELLLEDADLVFDKPVDAALAAQDLFEVRDGLEERDVLFFDLLPFESDEPLQTQVEDRIGLDLGQLEFLHQAGARFFGRLRAADELDDRVDVVERDAIAFEDVRALLRFAQVEAATAGRDFLAMLDVFDQHLAQGQRARLPVDEGDAVHAERSLERRVLVELVEDELALRFALELHDDAHALAVALVAKIGNARRLLVGDHLRDRLDEACLVHLERDLGDDDRLSPAAQLLEFVLRPHDQRAARAQVALTDAFLSEDESAT